MEWRDSANLEYENEQKSIKATGEYEAEFKFVNGFDFDDFTLIHQSMMP